MTIAPSMTIDFIRNYVYTAQAEAGQNLQQRGKLNQPMNNDVFQRFFDSGYINSAYRPCFHLIDNYRTPFINLNWNPANYIADFSSSNSVVNVNASGKAYSKAEEKEDEKEKRKRKSDQQAFIIGILSALAGSLALGRLYDVYTEHKQSAEYIDRVAMTIDQEQMFYLMGQSRINFKFMGTLDYYSFLAHYRNVIEAQQEINNRVLSKYKKYLGSTVTIIFSGIACIAGSYKDEFIKRAGFIGIIGSACLAAWTCSLHWKDRDKDDRCYKQIFDSSQKVITNLETIAWNQTQSQEPVCKPSAPLADPDPSIRFDVDELLADRISYKADFPPLYSNLQPYE